MKFTMHKEQEGNIIAINQSTFPDVYENILYIKINHVIFIHFSVSFFFFFSSLISSFILES